MPTRVRLFHTYTSDSLLEIINHVTEPTPASSSTLPTRSSMVCSFEILSWKECKGPIGSTFSAKSYRPLPIRFIPRVFRLAALASSCGRRMGIKPPKGPSPGTNGSSMYSLRIPAPPIPGLWDPPVATDGGVPKIATCRILCPMALLLAQACDAASAPMWKGG